MANLEYFKKGEEVFIKCKVSGVKITEDGLMYHLINPQTGRPFDWMFSEDKLFAIPAPETKTAKKGEKA